MRRERTIAREDDRGALSARLSRARLTAAFAMALALLAALPALAAGAVGDQHFQELIGGAEVPLPAFQIDAQWSTGVPAACGREDVAACAKAPNTVFISTRYPDRDVALHETGHLFDFAYMTPGDRAEALRLMRRTDQWAYGDPATAGEVFADVYATCGAGLEDGARQPDEGVQVAWTPALTLTRARMRQLCTLILAVGARNGLAPAIQPDWWKPGTSRWVCAWALRQVADEARLGGAPWQRTSCRAEAGLGRRGSRGTVTVTGHWAYLLGGTPRGRSLARVMTGTTRVRIELIVADDGHVRRSRVLG